MCSSPFLSQVGSYLLVVLCVIKSAHFGIYDTGAACCTRGKKKKMPPRCAVWPTACVAYMYVIMDCVKKVSALSCVCFLPMISLLFFFRENKSHTRSCVCSFSMPSPCQVRTSDDVVYSRSIPSSQTYTKEVSTRWNDYFFQDYGGYLCNERIFEEAFR